MNGGDQNVTISKSCNDLSSVLSVNDIEFKGIKPIGLLDRLKNNLKDRGVDAKIAEGAAKVMEARIHEGAHRYCVVHKNDGSESYVAFISIKDYPSATFADLLDGLMSIQARFNVLQRVKKISKTSSLKEVDKRADKSRDLDKHSGAVVQEYNQISEFLTKDTLAFLDMN